jgi:rod shape-determining protein MreC
VSLEYRVAAFVVLSVAVMFADSRFDYLDRVRYSLGFLIAPVYWVADIPVRVSYWIDDVFVSHGDLIEENTRLREELLFAQRELQLLAGLVSENNRLRALQEASRSVDGKILTAEIINVSTDPGSRRVLINRGAQHGVVAGQALLDANGLMGQVVEVLPFSSWVMLITDSRHGTPVQVNRNGERAIARGSRGAAPELELEYVPDTADIVVGDLLVSSGLGQRFPKDYPVAEVTSVTHDRGQAFASIKARPLAQLDRTRHVMLLALDTVAEDPLSGGIVPSWVDNTGASPETVMAEIPVADQEPEVVVDVGGESDLIVEDSPAQGVAETGEDTPLPSELADIVPELPQPDSQE